MNNSKVFLNTASGELFVRFYGTYEPVKYPYDQNKYAVLPVTRQYCLPEEFRCFPTSIHEVEVAYNAFYHHIHNSLRNQLCIGSPVTI